MKTPKQRVVIEIDPDTHDQLKAIAVYFGASVRGTIARYVRTGVAVDDQLIRGRKTNDR